MTASGGTPHGVLCVCACKCESVHMCYVWCMPLFGVRVGEETLREVSLSEILPDYFNRK